MPPRKPDAEYGDRQTGSTAYGSLETRGRKRGSESLEKVQARALELIAEGLSVPQVVAKLGRSEATFQSWRGRTPGFAESVDRIRARLNGDEQRKEVPDFGEFREKYLGMKTFWHQWQWVDLLEGRDPRDLHDAQTYQPGFGTKENILINTPPNFAKSTTITMDYVVWRICQDPGIRVLILSASEHFAKKFLLGIKKRLTHPSYAQLVADFGPSANGFQDPNLPWNGKHFYVAGGDPAEKDPTVEALGVNGQIYGARADLIIMDDCVTLKTSRTKGMREKTLEFIRSEVMSRLESDGRLVIVGTRLSFDDLYGEIVRQDEAGMWTYLTQPAILEWGETPDEHVTLWPFRWSGQALQKIIARHGTDMARFRLVYQQEAAPEDATFPEPAVRGCCTAGGQGVFPPSRPEGREGLYVVGGLDPAASGFTAIVVLGVDKRSKQRWLLDCMNQRAIKPHDLRAKMRDWTAKYKINEWRIEKNGLQTLLSQDRDLRMSMLALSSRIYEHHTVEYGQTGKWDPDYGVASMAPLFLGALEVPKANLIHLPIGSSHRASRELIDQLVSWEPGTVGKTDLVMALWFAELGCRRQLIQGTATHATNRWASPGRMAQRRVINIQDYLQGAAA